MVFKRSNGADLPPSISLRHPLPLKTSTSSLYSDMDSYYLDLITGYCSAAYFTVEEILVKDEERGGSQGLGYC
ncbi:hypothetical protein FRC00_009801, partial [Tulasnella sp. 408]